MQFTRKTIVPSFLSPSGAGIHPDGSYSRLTGWIPAFAGMTDEQLRSFAGMTDEQLRSFAGMTGEQLRSFAGMTGEQLLEMIVFYRTG